MKYFLLPFSIFFGLLSGATFEDLETRDQPFVVGPAGSAADLTFDEIRACSDEVTITAMGDIVLEEGLVFDHDLNLHSILGSVTAKGVVLTDGATLNLQAAQDVHIDSADIDGHLDVGFGGKCIETGDIEVRESCCWPAIFQFEGDDKEYLLISLKYNPVCRKNAVRITWNGTYHHMTREYELRFGDEVLTLSQHGFADTLMPIPFDIEAPTWMVKLRDGIALISRGGVLVESLRLKEHGQHMREGPFDAVSIPLVVGDMQETGNYELPAPYTQSWVSDWLRNSFSPISIWHQNCGSEGFELDCDKDCMICSGTFETDSVEEWMKCTPMLDPNITGVINPWMLASDWEEWKIECSYRFEIHAVGEPIPDNFCTPVLDGLPRAAWYKIKINLDDGRELLITAHYSWF